MPPTKGEFARLREGARRPKGGGASRTLEDAERLWKEAAVTLARLEKKKRRRRALEAEIASQRGTT
ncbi:MAG: hypothetical protein LBR22_04940 [Desulfovibrio sp.]|jgi:hypothetical protein|nr:hypothetical protein [Desulfovibrio sp.]